jgi:tetratricopeptide (TPR) repeat protein
MLRKSLRNRMLVPLALGAALLLACGSSGGKIVGSWRGTGGMGYNQDVADFFDDGSCKSLEGGERKFCAWTERASGGYDIRYGEGGKEAPLRADVDGDHMVISRDGHTESTWVRKGSELDKSVEAYTKGQSLIQSGDLEHGIAALKESADRGYIGAQSELAWTYATAKDPRFQDAKQAVSYAQKAVDQNRHYIYLDTLAAALARDGQFKKAAETETEALGLLERDTERPIADRKAAAERFRDRIDLYQGGQAYTEP